MADNSSSVRLIGETANPDSFILAGWSHTRALHTAYRELPYKQNVTLPICEVFSTKPPSEEYWAQLVTAGRDRNVVLSWKGNGPNIDFLFKSTPAFTVLSSYGFSEIDIDSVVIPYWLHAQRYLDDVREDIVLTWLLADLRARRIFFVGPPPPKSERVLRQTMSNDSYFLPKAANLGFNVSDIPLTGTDTRVALWEALCYALETRAKELGGIFVGVPSEAQNPDGTLKDELGQNDASHANALFGVMMWREIERIAAALNNV
jgi:hypothetical protein